MGVVYEKYTSEIPAKGKAYLVLKRCAWNEQDETLSRAREELLAAGAAEIYVTSHETAAPLEEREGTGYRLCHVRDMLWMERELKPLSPQSAVLTLDPLTREQGGAWLALHNECFFEMPNSATYGANDLERALSEACCCGFAILGGKRVGIYELNYTQELPEIEGIALHKDARRRGHGRELLCAVMAELAGQGYARCKLMVATDNTNAFALYRSMGFKATGVQSRWFQMLAAY